MQRTHFTVHCVYVTNKVPLPVVAKKFCINAAIASVTSGVQIISSMKEDQKTALRAFLSGKKMFTPFPTGFSSLIYILALPIALSH